MIFVSMPFHESQFLYPYVSVVFQKKKKDTIDAGLREVAATKGLNNDWTSFSRLSDTH